MIDMTFVSFLTLLVISLICALIAHYGIRCRVLDGADGCLAKWVVGWVGAWVGSPVLGRWFANARIASVYIVPAFTGGFVGAFLTTVVWKAEAKVASQHPA